MYRLAVELKEPNVDVLLQKLKTWHKFREWKTFFELEPPASERADWNIAHIVQVLARSSGKQLKEYMLPFGDYLVEAAPQPVSYQEMVIDAWIGASNAILNAKKK